MTTKISDEELLAMFGEPEATAEPTEPTRTDEPQVTKTISDEENAMIFGDEDTPLPKTASLDAETIAELERALEEEAHRNPKHPVKAAAEAVLAEFLEDKIRVRTRHFGGEWLGFIVTSKPLPSAPPGSPIWHAGLEPFPQIQFAGSGTLLTVNGRALTATRTTAAFEHTVWVVRVGEGQLVRVWGRARTATSNQRELFWGLVRSGDANVLDRKTYNIRRQAAGGTSK